MKRGFDIVAALVGLVCLSPVLLVLALAVRLDTPGPAIFAQTRIGRWGRPFVCLKLRTMHTGTQNAPSHEVGGDAITPMGHRLRRTKLDELPQLWNILIGEMSLVGPRPCLPAQTVLIEARRRYGLDALRPGITGVAQVAGVDMSDPEKLAALDATYLTTQSFGTDLRIIVATIFGAGRGDRTNTQA